MKKILAIILIMVFMVTGCGKIDEEPLTKKTEKKEENVTVDEMEIKEDAEVGGEEIVTEETTEDVIEMPTASVPENPVQKEETKKKTQTTEAKTATETEAPTVTTPTIADPVATTPEPGAQECQHWYQPVETEEYDMISHYVFASNCCGYPLFTIENNDAVNIPDLYVHPDYHDEESGIECTKNLPPGTRNTFIADSAIAAIVAFYSGHVPCFTFAQSNVLKMRGHWESMKQWSLGMHTSNLATADRIF